MPDKRITPVKDWPEAERPREPLISHGPAALGKAQLLAIIIRNGRVGRTALDLGRDLLKRIGSLLGIEQAGIGEICAVSGIGKAKAAKIKAAIAIRKSAAAVIFIHNHPSGDTEPSQEDILLTRRLVQAGELLGIQVLDHIIIGDGSHFSFRENGMIGHAR